MLGDLRELIQLGQSESEIRATFSARYGTETEIVPKVLAAWVIPLLALLVGGVGVGVTIAQWTRQHPPDGAKLEVRPVSPDDTDRPATSSETPVIRILEDEAHFRQVVERDLEQLDEP